MDMKELQKIKTNYNNARNGEDSAKYYKQFLQGVCECINEGAWLNFPVNQDGKGVGTVIINHHNRLYIAAYATQEKSISKDIVCCDINKVVDAVYASGELSGIIFDPNNKPIFINRDVISDHTKRKDPRLQQVDWGEGIPDYKPNDLLTPIEVFDFAMQVLGMYFRQEGYEILNRINFPGAINNYDVEKDGKRYFVVVREYLYENPRKISEQERQECLRAAKQMGVIPVVAYVGFCSTDETRFNEKLALYGDGYYCNFEGLEEIK